MVRTQSAASLVRRPGSLASPATLPIPLPQVRVAARLHGAAEALVALREELPEANVSSLAARNLPLLLLPPEQLRQDVQQVL